MRIHRLIAILTLLESRGRVKARELAEALETSERTIHRDISALCESGIPIAAVAGPSGGFELMEGYTSRLNSLHHEEAISLFLSGIGIQPQQHSDSHSSLMTALAKLEGSLPEAYRPDIVTARERFHFDPTNWWDDLAIPPCLDILRRSVWQSHKLEIFYRNAVGEQSVRVLHPYGLVVKVMIWYLVAYCEERREIRIFRCDRIEQASMLDDTFDRPRDFSLESFWNTRSRAFMSEVIERERHER